MAFDYLCRLLGVHFDVGDLLFACLKNLNNGLILADADAAGL